MPGREILAAGAAETAAVADTTAGAIAGGLGVEKTAVAEDKSRKNALDLC
jgi:hypothetical protein